MRKKKSVPATHTISIQDIVQVDIDLTKQLQDQIEQAIARVVMIPFGIFSASGGGGASSYGTLIYGGNGTLSHTASSYDGTTPYDGVRVGEVEAWRTWRVDKRCLLRSMYADKRWLPGVPMEGDIDAIVGQNPLPWGPIKGGIYALRDVSSVLAEFGPKLAEGDELLAVGSVLLSGDVIEGQRGYRASMAQIGTIVSCRDRFGQEQPEALAAINVLYAPPHLVPDWMTEIYHRGKRIGLARIAAGADRPHEVLKRYEVQGDTEWGLLASNYAFTPLPQASSSGTFQ